MCLSRIYIGDKNEKNCLIDEAARVESRDNLVKVATLFGETQTFHGYSVDTVDFMDNFVMLKKAQKGRSHDTVGAQKGKQAAGKIQKALYYLLSHNRSHAADLEKWVVTAEEAGYKEVSEELKTAMELFMDVNRHFEKAISKLTITQ